VETGDQELVLDDRGELVHVGARDWTPRR